MKSLFEGRIVILTGGASGIGRAMVRILARSGAHVHALDVDEQGLNSLSRDCQGTGSITAHQVDVRDRSAMSQAISRINASSARIDYLFNNAGVTQLGEAYRIPFERWKWVLDINLMGVVHGTHLVYPIMVAQGSGHIVNTASIAGNTGYATAAAYTASKAAVLEFTRSLRAEAAKYGVKVSVACPGYVDSGIFTQDRIVGVDREEMIRDLPVKMMTTDEAAYGLLRGVARSRKTIVFPLSARLLWSMSNWTPRLITPFQRRFLRLFRKA